MRSPRRDLLDRHLEACAAIGRAGAVIGLIAGAAALTPARGDMYYSTYVFSTTYPAESMFINVDYASGIIGTKISTTSVGADFTGYEDYELQVIQGKFGPTLYDNTGDSKILYVAGVYGGFTFYTYPYKLAVGYLVDDSSKFAPYPDKAFVNELSTYNPYWAPEVYAYGGTSGSIGWALADTSSGLKTFGSIYFSIAYDIVPAGKFEWEVSFIQWDSTATSITVATEPGGAIPEPGGLGLGALALGAAGLRGWRRRRQERAAA